MKLQNTKQTHLIYCLLIFAFGTVLNGSFIFMDEPAWATMFGVAINIVGWIFLLKTINK